MYIQTPKKGEIWTSDTLKGQYYIVNVTRTSVECIVKREDQYHVFKEGILNFVRSHNPLTKSMIPVESLFEKYLTMKIKDNTK